MTMPDHAPDDRLLPQHEGSAESLAVLHAMADWRSPVCNPDLQAITDLSSLAVSQALQGLKKRGRVLCEGTGPRAVWRLAHMVRQAA